jgi:hypothetical protein
LHSEAIETDESYCHPKTLAEASHTGEWTALDDENEPFTVFDIMSETQAEEIEKDLGVKFSSALGGKLVYISGHSEESINNAQKKLRVMLVVTVSLWKR